MTDLNITSVEDYVKQQEACGFKIGDLVTVTHRVNSGEEYWNNDWADKMDKFINQLCIVIDDYPYALSYGVRIRLLDTNTHMKDKNFGFPFFVIKKL